MPAVGGAESLAPALSPGTLLCIPRNPSSGSGRCEVPRGRKWMSEGPSLHFLRFLWAGLRCISASCPHELPASHPLSWAVGVGALGFLFQLGAQPQARCQLLLCPRFLPLPSDLTLKRDHTSLSGLSEGCQLPSDPIRSHQRPSVCVGEVRGPLWVGLGPLWGRAGRAQGQRPGDLVPPP